MIKAVVIGAAGRMGNRLVHAVCQAEGIVLSGGIERKGHPAIGRDIGEINGLEALGVPLADELASVIDNCDVVIDFTAPAVSLKSLELASAKKKAIVIGTTGFTDSDKEKIRKTAAGTRCVLAPNMSVGVNLMFRLVEDVTKIIGEEYDIEMIEAHHRLKKDAPSGTAVKLAEIIADALKRDLNKVGVFGRKGMIGERKKEEIGIQTIRGGDIVGEHTVIFFGAGERIEITHKAHSRDNFARGAVKAALWIVGQKPGLYDMQDVLGLRKRRD
jgi:4-hydroxy-tetrahydrodipicolinate reductase